MNTLNMNVRESDWIIKDNIVIWKYFADDQKNGRFLIEIKMTVVPLSISLVKSRHYFLKKISTSQPKA